MIINIHGNILKSSEGTATTLSPYYIDLPFMAHSRSSYCIDLPFMAYSTVRQQTVQSNALTFTYGSSPCGCSGDLGAARFNHFASEIEST